MEYNSYYLPQPGHPSPPVTSLHGGHMMQQQHSPQGSQMMHAPMTPLGARQNMTQGLPHLHQQQHLSHHHSQQMSTQQQQQQHPSYHHIQQPHSHGSPVSHASSPHPHPHQHPQQQQQLQQHQQHLNHIQLQSPLSAPSPHQQSSLQSQQHLGHPQSPHHHVGSPMHMQQQSANKMVRSSMGQLSLNHQQSGIQVSQHYQNQNSYGHSNTIHVQANLNHYPQQNQHHTIHHQQQQQQQQHQHNHQQQHRSQTPLRHHTPSVTPNSHHVQQGRNTPHHSNFILQTEIRVIELNRRLQCRPIDRHPVSPLPNDTSNDCLWWERFASEFFEDDATLTIRVHDDKPVDYTIGRTLIPRFFKSYFAGGVTDLSINLRNAKEATIQPQLVTLDCDQTLIMTNNVFRHPAIATNQAVVVHTEGHLILDFVSNNLDSLSIKSWRFYTRSYKEYIDRSMTAVGIPNSILVEPLTVQGLPNTTMIFLRMCALMKQMQEIMGQHKMTNMSPRNCLKKILFEKYRFKSGDETKTTQVTKRRKRKPPTSPVTVGNITTSTSKKSRASPGTNLPTMSSISPSTISNMPPLKIMVVGEPSSMETEYRDDNERSISRIENANYASPVSRDSESPIEKEIARIESELIENNLSEIEAKKMDLPKEDGKTLELTCSQKSDESHLTNCETSAQTQDLNQQKSLETKVEPIQEVKPPPKQPSPRNVTPPATSVSVGTTTTSTTGVQADSETKPVQSVTTCVTTGSQVDQSDSADIEEPVEKEKENNINLVINDEPQTSSVTVSSENHYNIMSSIPEDREDTTRSTSCDSNAKLPPSSNSKNTLTPNGTSNKQNRRRSSERKETVKEGLMKISDFIVKIEDLKYEHPILWRITGQSLLQQFEPKTQNGVVLYENTNQYAGWCDKIKEDYVGVDVKLTQHTRNQITVEKLLLNFKEIEKPENFYDKHFVIYLQILISTALDPKFWESIESEPQHHDYFITSRRIVEDITKRFKIKLSSKLKLSETFMKNVEKYPNLVVKTIDQNEKEQICRACSTNLSTQVISFGNRSYDLHSYKPVKVTSESDEKDLHSDLCEVCFDLVKLYSEIHHMGWTLYNIAKEKVEVHRTFGKPINAILDECLKDEDWLSTIYTLRDSLWSKVELIQ